MESVSEKDNLNCAICDVEVASEQNLENHIQFFHDGKMPFKCPICDAGFASESVLKDHLASIDCEEVNLKDVLDFENKDSILSADEETEQKSALLFNSNKRSLKKVESEFKQIFQSTIIEKEKSTFNERKYSIFDERKDPEVNTSDLLMKRTCVMQACDSNAKVVEFHPNDFSKEEKNKFPIDGQIDFIVPQNGSLNKISDNFSSNLKGKGDVVVESMHISRKGQQVNKNKINSRWMCPICYTYKKSEIYLKNHMEVQHDAYLQKVKSKHEEFIATESRHRNKLQNKLQNKRLYGIGDSDKKEKIWICSTCYKYLKTKIDLKNHMESVHDQRNEPLNDSLTSSDSDSELRCELNAQNGSPIKQDLKSKIDLKNHMESVHDQRKEPLNDSLTFSDSDSEFISETSAQNGSPIKRDDFANMNKEISTEVIPRSEEKDSFIICNSNIETFKAVIENVQNVNKYSPIKKNVHIQVHGETLQFSRENTLLSDGLSELDPGKKVLTPTNNGCNVLSHQNRQIGPSFGLKVLDDNKSKYNSEKSFQCPDCNKSFSHNSILESHLATKYNCVSYILPNKHQSKLNDSNGSRHFCVLCEKKFTLKRNLDRHVLLKHETDPSKKNTFSCPKCMKSFTMKQTLTRHLDLGRCKYPGPNKNPLCAICNIVFVNKRALVTHVQKVHKDLQTVQKVHENTKKPHQYSSGQGTLRYILPKPSTKPIEQNQQNSIAILPSTHTPLNVLAPVQFIKSTLPPQKIPIFQMPNTAPALFVRPLVEKGTEGASDPKEFVRLEKISEREIDNHHLLGLLPIEQDSGPVKQDINNSKESKQTKKSWICSFCSFEFDTIPNLRDHVSSKHNGQKHDTLFNCPYCVEKFPTSQDLGKHISSEHRGQKNYKAHKCSFCDETFSSSNDLVLHTSNFHVCLYCSETFAQKNGLKDHIQSAHGQNYESKKSVKDHGIRCDICNKKFSCQESLKDHAYQLMHW